MLKDLFSNRLFIGALAFFVLCVGGSLLYMQHVEQQSAREMAAHEERMKQLTDQETQQPTTAVSSVGAQTEPGDFHSDGTLHAEPHERIAAPSEVSESDVSTQVSPLRIENDRGAGNPLPYGNVDIRDFEAAKAAMIENLNFVKANWDPKTFSDKELGRELRIAYARGTNIHNAAMSGIYTREQAREMNALYFSLSDFRDPNPGRVSELQEQGHTLKEAIRISAEEAVELWGVE